MSRTRSHTMLGISIALLLLVAVLAAGPSSASGPSRAEPRDGADSAAPVAPQSSPEQSKVWGAWPVLPWDDQSVGPSPWAHVLNRPLALARRGKPGEERRYQIKRTNLTVDRQGAAINRMIAEGQLHRTLLREAEPGIWVEQCEWERFAVAQGMTPSDYPTPQELPGAQGISFEFSPRTFDYVNPSADFARVGDEMSGYLLKVLTMDAMGWDAILLGLREEKGDKVRIGDSWRETKWEPWDITRVGAEGTVGQYQAGELQVSVVGLTRRQGQPCLLIWFSMEGNKVSQKMESPTFAMDMLATEYFRGELVVSLRDGHLVGMELSGPLPCILKLGFGGQPATEQPIGAIIQQVSMWEIPTAPQKDSPAP